MDGCDFDAGQRGVIVTIYQFPFFDDVSIGVEWWNIQQPIMHDCNGTCKDGYGFFVFKQYLRVIEAKKMDGPKTTIEKNACNQAITDAIDAEVKLKKETYTRMTKQFISDERNARTYKERAEGLKKTLCLTEEQIKEMI